MIEVFIYVDKTNDQHNYVTMLKYKQHKKMFKGSYNNLTTNESTLMALQYTLNQITNHNHNIKIYTTSKYINDTIRFKWFNKWELNGWITNEGTKVKYRDLWLEIIDNLGSFKKVLVMSPKEQSNENLLQCEKYLKEEIK